MPSLLALGLLAAPALAQISAGPPVVVARVERPVLAMAFATRDRVLLLEDDRVSCWRLGPSSLTREDELLNPAPERVRWPGGLIQATSGSPAFWVLRSGWADALLLAVEEKRTNTRLMLQGKAAAIPWAGALGGLRFRPGTNLIEGALAGMGAGPFLGLSADGRAAVDADGRLRRYEDEDDAQPIESCRMGSTLVQPWPELLVVSSPGAAADTDAVLAWPLDGKAASETLASFPGLVQALAALTDEDRATLLVATRAAGQATVTRLDLRRPAAVAP